MRKREGKRKKIHPFMPFSQDVTPIFFYCCLLAILPGDLLSRVVAKNTTRLEKNESIGNKDLK